MNSLDFMNYCDEMMIEEEALEGFSENIKATREKITWTLKRFVEELTARIIVEASKMQGYYLYNEGFVIMNDVINTFTGLLFCCDDEIRKLGKDISGINDGSIDAKEYKEKMAKNEPSFWKAQEKTQKQHRDQLAAYKKRIESKTKDEVKRELCNDKEMMLIQKRMNALTKELRIYTRELAKLPKKISKTSEQSAEAMEIIKIKCNKMHQNLVEMSKIYFEAASYMKAKPKSKKKKEKEEETNDEEE